MKKLTAIFMSFLLVFGLTACGGQDDSSAQDTEKAQEAQTVQAEDSEEPQESAEAEKDSGAEDAPDGAGDKTLVVYYSASGNTKTAAEYIASATNGETFELEPKTPYSGEDLDWTDDGSRVVHEYENPDERTVELVAETVPDWDSYDTVFIGYPIWWGIAAWPVNGFVQANDFTGKTVIPFCTSASSGLGESGELLEEMAKTGEWLEGERFASGASEETVQEWVKSLGL